MTFERASAIARQWWHCLTHFHRPMTASHPIDATDYLCRDCRWAAVPWGDR